MFYHLRSFRMLWIWNFDQCSPFTNKVDFITSILNFLDPWNIGFWSVKFSKLTRHGNWSDELLLFIKVHLRWKVQVPHFLKSVHIWSFSVFFVAPVWILRFTEQSSIFILNAEKYEPEKFRTQALFT